MSEKMPGLTILGKINLDDSSKYDGRPKAPRPEKYLPELKANLLSMAARLSGEHGNFFNAEGQITIDGPEADFDNKQVENKELEFAVDCHKSREAWRADCDKNPAHITELALTLLFDKILRDDFIIVRASAYDDYENGADNLIIDKKTGAVICGVDDVIRYEGDNKNRNEETGKTEEKKDEKIRRKMASGGATIKYGATFVDGRLERKCLEHIPLFYFSLDKKDLDQLLLDMAARHKDVSVKEREVFSKLSHSLADQSTKFSNDRRLNPDLRDNLKKFGPSLEKILAYSHQN